METPSTSPTPTSVPGPSAAGAGSSACASCGEPLVEGFAFCENCGAPTGTTPAAVAPPVDEPVGLAVPPVQQPDEGDSTRTILLSHPGDDATQHQTPTTEHCSCGGTFEDGWCGTCGAPRPDERDHVVVTLSPGLGSVSDRGIVHHRNEDAGTVVQLGPAVACIVCDGVSNVEGSQEASAAAVEATAGTLSEASRDPSASSAEGWLPALRQARRSAAVAAAACTRPGASEAASCTWAAAVTDDLTVWAAWVGDSRIYLVGDDGRGHQLGSDHSWAAEAVAAGADPATVMNDRRAHMITAWMGADAPELPDATLVAPVEGPGWLLAVSDGLWNYCEGGDDLAALVARLGGPSLGATELAEALVGFANAAGGADNITISAARLAGATTAATPASTTAPAPAGAPAPTSTPAPDPGA
jgi:serine/threonine protein phosphatase PrpC